MNLSQLRSEVLAHGFDANVFSARITTYLNDAQNQIARRVDYYVDEATQDYSTVAGTTSYTLPADFARGRSLRDTNRGVEMAHVGLRQIDRSGVASGAPMYYALDGMNMHLYPTPDGVYPMELRYWKMPVQLANDTDTPSLPSDYHSLLWTYALAQCYAGEDDVQSAQYWKQEFLNGLAMFAADQKFPSTDYPTQVAGMWDRSSGLGGRGWSIFGSSWE